jgi:hypothetical protein
METLLYTPQIGFSIRILAETRDPTAVAEQLAWAESKWRFRPSLRRASLLDAADGQGASRRGPGQ